MHSDSSGIRRCCWLLIPGLLLLTGAGCVSQLGALMYLVNGGNVAPEFAGLEGKKVALVVLSDSSPYGPNQLAYSISKSISRRLMTAPDEISVVPPGVIDEFMDLHGWDESRIVELGEFAEADMVLVIEVRNYSIHDGQTMYKGRSEYDLSVYDIEQDGKLVFAKGPEDYVYPKNGRPALETNDREFESFYLASLTNHLARMIVTHEKVEGFASEAAMN